MKQAAIMHPLFVGQLLNAQDADYSDTVEFSLRCAECGEEVYLAKGKKLTPHFRHARKDVHRDCSLRVMSFYNGLLGGQQLADSKGQRWKLLQEKFRDCVLNRFNEEGDLPYRSISSHWPIVQQIGTEVRVNKMFREISKYLQRQKRKEHVWEAALNQLLVDVEQKGMANVVEEFNEVDQYFVSTKAMQQAHRDPKDWQDHVYGWKRIVSRQYQVPMAAEAFDYALLPANFKILRRYIKAAIANIVILSKRKDYLIGYKDYFGEHWADRKEVYPWVIHIILADLLEIDWLKAYQQHHAGEDINLYYHGGFSYAPHVLPQKLPMLYS